MTWLKTSKSSLSLTIPQPVEVQGVLALEGAAASTSVAVTAV